MNTDRDAVFDEDGIKIRLAGQPEEIAEGLDLIHRHLCKKISGHVRSRFPGLSAEDLVDVWQDTLISAFRSASEGSFQLDGKLLPWLCKIARRRAVDMLRWDGKHRKAIRTTDEEALDAVGEAIAGTSTGIRWKLLEAQERAEALELAMAHIRTLPRKQRIVLQAFCDGYPNTDEMGTLRQDVSSITGEEETLGSVKRALQEGRRKLREHIERLGYHETRR